MSTGVSWTSSGGLGLGPCGQGSSLELSGGSDSSTVYSLRAPSVDEAQEWVVVMTNGNRP